MYEVYAIRTAECQKAPVGLKRSLIVKTIALAVVKLHLSEISCRQSKIKVTYQIIPSSVGLVLRW